MSDNSISKTKQVIELNSASQVNDRLKKGWTLLAVTALTHRHDGGHEEAETIYVLGTEEESEEITSSKFGNLTEQLKK